MDLQVIILIFLILNIAITLAFAFKLRKYLHWRRSDSDRQTANASTALFRQIQAFLSLDKLIDVGPWLPPLRGWAASPDFLLVVVRHVLDRKPSVIVECGSGASTLVLAKCCRTIGRGHVFSLDHEARFAQQTRDRLASAGLSE